MLPWLSQIGLWLFLRQPKRLPSLPAPWVPVPTSRGTASLSCPGASALWPLMEAELSLSGGIGNRHVHSSCVCLPFCPFPSRKPKLCDSQDQHPVQRLGIKLSCGGCLSLSSFFTQHRHHFKKWHEVLEGTSPQSGSAEHKGGLPGCKFN